MPNDIPQPEDIYARTKEEGERRLERPVAEEVSTALAAGFDIVAGVILLGLLGSLLEHRFGVEAAHVFASIGFGVGFVFLVVGRGELFTENFLVPLAGLDHRNGASWRNLAKLWTLSPIFNVIGGVIIILIVSTHGVLPLGTGTPIVDAAFKIHANRPLALFLSAIFAGALITAMTWFVEGSESMGIRVTVSWICGTFLALGSLNHVIVVTLELIFGYRYGMHLHWTFILENFFVAAAGNAVGGIGLVTLNRLTQGTAGQRSSSSA
jgi:formate/nitrite transporter FocA (FNT family)